MITGGKEDMVIRKKTEGELMTETEGTTNLH